MGLAIGGLVAERFARRYSNALRPYLILEAVIGLSGIVLLPVLLNLDHMVAFAPALASWFSLKFLFALMVLALPTIAMGATFPVMAAVMVKREAEIGSRLSLLYGLNTGGAVLGAALSGFGLIPNWGLDGAIYVAVALNFTIVAVGWLMSNTFSAAHPRRSLPPETSSSALTFRYTPQQWRALVALFATGFAAISSQVGWTKYLSVFAGTTIYGFAAILTVFLAGIAGGSFFMKRRLDAIASPERLLALGLVVVGVALLLTRAGLTAVPSIYRAVNSLSEWPLLVHSAKYAVVFVLLILPTLLFGALFPLNLKLYCDSLHGLQTRLGRAYAVNTLAALLGAVCAGFWLIPTYGANAVLTGSAFLLLAAALLYVPVFATVPRTAFATLVATGFILSTALPSLRYQDLIASVQYAYDIDAKGVAAPQFKFLKVGRHRCDQGSRLCAK